jgi:hypothetical protein
VVSAQAASHPNVTDENARLELTALGVLEMPDEAPFPRAPLDPRPQQ